MEEKPNPCSMQLPPGFRFYPSDEELIVHYLRNKVTSTPVPASIIADIDLYKFNPWDLPNQALFGEEEWYFFTPRDRKYPNGARPNRAAASGYWKATGTDKPIVTSCGSKRVGVKKALVFYTGRPPKGVKTDWIMNEYRILDAMIWSSKRKGSMRLDDWVLCRVRKKSGNLRNSWDDRRNYAASDPETFSYLPNLETYPKNNANPNLEMIKNSVYQGCPLLPCIFSPQKFPTSLPNLSFQQGKFLDLESKSNNKLLDQGNNNLESCFSPAAANFSVVVNDGGEEGKPIVEINDSGFFGPYDQKLISQRSSNGEEEVMASAWPLENSEGSISYLAGYEWNHNSSTSTQSRQFQELNGMMAFNGTPLQFG